MSVTIHDVARSAGLSVATVSRVLNGKGPVREETRVLVEDAVARLRYVPHGAARSLITKKTRTIGVVLPDIHGEFFSEVIRGLDLTARRHGYHILVSGSHSDKRETGEVLRAMRGRVDGVVVMSPTIAPEEVRANLPESFPVVLLNATGAPDVDSISIDNRGGAAAMVRHLLALGHRRIAFLRGPSGNRDAEERRRGFLDAIHDPGISPGSVQELPGDFTEESGARAGEALAASDPRPTAVFSSNDAMAIGCLASLRAAGLRVPEEVALAGFDDIPVGRYVSPPLSTVHVGIDALGTRAMERLLDALRRGHGHRTIHETLPTALVIRGSCGASLKAPARFTESNLKGRRTV